MSNTHQAPRLGYVILYVDTLDRAIGFYTEVLGFALRARHGEYAEIETGATTLGLAERNFVAGHFTGELPPPGQGASEIGVVVDRTRVDDLYAAAVNGGATVVLEPQDQPWGQRVSYVRDPDGHLVEICSPVGE